jgi:hypothetical protein
MKKNTAEWGSHARAELLRDLLASHGGASDAAVVQAVNAAVGEVLAARFVDAFEQYAVSEDVAAIGLTIGEGLVIARWLAPVAAWLAADNMAEAWTKGYRAGISDFIAAQGITPDDLVTRIEWRYLDTTEEP